MKKNTNKNTLSVWQERLSICSIHMPVSHSVYGYIKADCKLINKPVTSTVQPCLGQIIC